jgi:hypothetical protein
MLLLKYSDTTHPVVRMCAAGSDKEAQSGTKRQIFVGTHEWNFVWTLVNDRTDR